MTTLRKDILGIALIVFLVAFMFIVIASIAMAGDENFGKADDYGSDRFVMVNKCEVYLTKYPQPGETDPAKMLARCMEANGFAFLPDAKIFGDRGPRCDEDGEGLWHSWCWEHELGEFIPKYKQVPPPEPVPGFDASMDARIPPPWYQCGPPYQNRC